MNRHVSANYVCRKCSKKLGAKMICSTPTCPRCCSFCEVEPVDKTDAVPPLDAAATRAVAISMTRIPVRVIEA